jgi:hypothetical protein
VYKRKFCDCGKDAATDVGSGSSTLESNVQFVENPLVGLQTAILAVATEGLAHAQAAAAALVGGAAPWLAIYVDRTKTFLGGLVTMSDYHNITWNSVNRCSDLTIRIGFVWFKYNRYVQTLTACNANTSWTFAHQASLNATAVGVVLNDRQSAAVRGLIGSMLRLQPLMRNYSSQLSYSVTKMWKIWVDIKYRGDSYCGCRDKNGTTTRGSTTVGLKSSSVMTTTMTSGEKFREEKNLLKFLIFESSSSSSAITSSSTSSTTVSSTSSTAATITTSTAPSTTTSMTVQTTSECHLNFLSLRHLTSVAHFLIKF